MNLVPPRACSSAPPTAPARSLASTRFSPMPLRSRSSLFRTQVFAIILLGVATRPALATTDPDYLGAGQRVSLRQLNPHLPDITLKSWIDGLATPQSPAEWEVNDCGEATGGPADTLRDLPACSQAKVTLADGGEFYMVVAVGTNDRGVWGPPGVYYAQIVRGDSIYWFGSAYEIWRYFERQKDLDPRADPMRERVRQAVLHAWQGYRQYAWGHDDLNPLTHTPRDWYGHTLLMTPVDGYDTLLLLGLTNEAREAG